MTWHDLLEKWLPFGGPIVVLVGGAYLLDKANIINRKLKSRWVSQVKKLAIFRASDGTYPGAKRVHSIVSRLFGVRSIPRFLLRSALATVFIVLTLMALQILMNANDFEVTTFPFLRAMASLDGAPWIIFFGVVIVDFLSIAMTIFFLRIAAYCKAWWEIIALTVADGILSLVLFILGMPLFITLAFLLTQPTDGNLHILIGANEPTRQGSRDMDVVRGILTFDPRNPSAKYEKIADPLKERKWLVYTYNIYVASKDSATGTLSEIYATAYNAGSVTVYVHGKVSNSDAIGFVVESLKKQRGVNALRVLERSDSFYSSMWSLQFHATASISFSYYWKVYGRVLSAANFLDDKFLQIVALESPAVSQNDVIHSYASESSFSRYLLGRQKKYSFCDGATEEMPAEKPFEIDTKLDSCKSAMSLDSFGLENIIGLARYDLDRNISVPMSPFALSSLTATILIYYVVFCLIMFAFIRWLIGKMVTHGERVLEKYFFTLMVISCGALAMPILFIASRVLFS